ncbi:MAG TPA: tricarballylate utilization 4Fe-4S protein TcuB [Bryobacteraceae bacterium]
MRPSNLPIEEGQRLLRLCNACRYCEGFCAVFPAMERRSVFTAADVNYLANLCHNCGECYYACPYTPPHEYALNLPKVLAEIRMETYARSAVPRSFSLAGRNSARAVSALVVVAIGLIVCIVAAFGGFASRGADFYAVIPHEVMAITLGLAFVLAVILMMVAFSRFWRDGIGVPIEAGPLITALGDTLRLTNLDGHGAGCPYPQARLSQMRRWFHHATFYGFLLCFASTCVAASYHFWLGWRAPYPYLSAPVVLGTLGGVGLLAGPAGLLWLRRKRDPALDDLNPRDFGESFIVLLLLASFTGLLLLALRETGAMSWLLTVHLGVVLALFASLPYGKFMHGKFRFAALVRNSFEQSRRGRQLPVERHGTTVIRS